MLDLRTAKRLEERTERLNQLHDFLINKLDPAPTVRDTLELLGAAMFSYSIAAGMSLDTLLTYLTNAKTSYAAMLDKIKTGEGMN